MSEELFSVYQFFADGGCERVRELVGPEDAFRAAKNCTTSLGGQWGTTVRVIVTDGGDNTVFEWKHGQGVTYPPWDPEKGQVVAELTTGDADGRG